MDEQMSSATVVLVLANDNVFFDVLHFQPVSSIQNSTRSREEICNNLELGTTF